MAGPVLEYIGYYHYELGAWCNLSSLNVLDGRKKINERGDDYEALPVVDAFVPLLIPLMWLSRRLGGNSK